MFDIGFLELFLIFVVILLVFGPEKLPEITRKIGLYLGKIKNFTTKIQDDVNRELKLEELRQELDSLKLQQQLDAKKSKLQQELNSVQSELNTFKQTTSELREKLESTVSND